MAPRTGSRHSFALGVPDELGRRFLSEREPYRFKEHTDTRVHVVAQGDSLEGLAGRYFAPLPRACGFWWVLADFQPDPIVDPTLGARRGPAPRRAQPARADRRHPQ
jgi:hypothetical protein